MNIIFKDNQYVLNFENREVIPYSRYYNNSNERVKKGVIFVFVIK